MINTDLLKKISLFEGFTDAQLMKIVDIAREKEVLAGDTIFDEDSQASALFIIRSGTVEITKHGSNDDQRVATFSAGSHFGEMGFLDQSRRTASAMAKGENGLVLEIAYSQLGALAQADQDLGLKLYRNFAHALARRIRQTTLDLSTLRDLKLRHM